MLKSALAAECNCSNLLIHSVNCSQRFTTLTLRPVILIVMLTDTKKRNSGLSFSLCDVLKEGHADILTAFIPLLLRSNPLITSDTRLNTVILQ